MGGGQDKPAWTACPPGVKITRVRGKISRDSLPPGRQAYRGWLVPRGASCPGGQEKLGHRRLENSSKIPAHGIYRSVKLFLLPIKLREISIMMRNCDYNDIKTVGMFKWLETLGSKLSGTPCEKAMFRLQMVRWFPSEIFHLCPTYLITTDILHR